jgi:lysophospholipase L1-like esterase
MRKPLLVVVCVIGLAGNSSLRAAAAWVGTWGAAPLPPSPAFGPAPATPAFANQTIRQIVRVSVGGSRLRVRFTNEYGTKALAIGKASVAVLDSAGQIKPGTERPLTFAGNAGVSIPAASPLLSDPVELPVQALSSLAISMYFPEDTGPCTCHATGMQKAEVSDAGDFTAAAFTSKQIIQSRAFISGVEVQSGGKAVVVLGDSISDGIGSTVDANRRWPDRLAERLDARAGKSGWGIVNMGISGNRVLNDGAGQSALARFDRDVLSVPGAAYVIIFEGVNDLGLAYGQPQGPLAERFRSLMPATKPTAQAMIAGYTQLIERAHSKGLKVIGATITPYGGAVYYSAEGEAIRQAINTWIRTGRAFDGVVDFDAVVRDPAQPTQMKDGFHAGDHLHGSDAAYEAMAQSIDLSLLK